MVTVVIIIIIIVTLSQSYIWAHSLRMRLSVMSWQANKKRQLSNVSSSGSTLAVVVVVFSSNFCLRLARLPDAARRPSIESRGDARSLASSPSN